MFATLITNFGKMNKITNEACWVSQVFKPLKNIYPNEPLICAVNWVISSASWIRVRISRVPCCSLFFVGITTQHRHWYRNLSWCCYSHKLPYSCWYIEAWNFTPVKINNIHRIGKLLNLKHFHNLNLFPPVQYVSYNVYYSQFCR